MAASEARTGNIKRAITEVINENQSIPTLKQEQEDVLVEFLGGKDVLAILPTGFGKSKSAFMLIG